MSYRTLKPALIPTNIKKVAANRILRAKASYVINQMGEGYFLLGGDKISEKHFELIFPVEIKKDAPVGGYCNSYQNCMV